MTNDRIIELAKQAGIHDWWEIGNENLPELEQLLQTFANLIRNEVLDESAKVCDDAMEGIWQFHPEYVNEVGRNCCTNLAVRIRSLKK